VTHSGGNGHELHEITPLARSIHLDSRFPRREIDLTVNRIKYRLSVATNELLLTVLRENFELTGTKYGCGIGECSACTVQMDGKPVLSCLVLAISADGSEIVTVEGLQKPTGDLDPLQESFIEYAATQCGYCTPGMLMTAKSLLNENPTPTEDEVRDYLKGNLCRCTGYASIVRAVLNCNDKSIDSRPL
jgi:carbon-monoxide dehydrogenase small subunit